MLDYNEKLKPYYHLGIQELRDEIDKKGTKIKIKNHCERWDDDFDSIRTKILDDDQFARFFIKDPKKRNLYEKMAVDYITTKLNRDIVKLSSEGSTALCLQDGKIIKGSSTLKTTKSIDFMELRDGKIYYYSHKYINADGGHQDNQYRELSHFSNEAKKYVEQNDDNIHFVLLGDGEYFKRKNRKYEIYTGHRVTMMNINEL